MNGFEVAKKLREKLELGKVVLVAMTGYGQESDNVDTSPHIGGNAVARSQTEAMTRLEYQQKIQPIGERPLTSL